MAGSVEVQASGAVVVRGPVSGGWSSQLRRAALDAVDAAVVGAHVVIDLVRCTGLDDSALVALICADHHAVRSGRRLVLRGPSRCVRRTIADLAGSLLPLIEDVAPVRRERTARPLRLVIDLTSPCATTCDGAPCGGACTPAALVAERPSRVPRWRDPLRRPSRPPAAETA